MHDDLRSKLLILNQRLWEQNAKWTQIEAWLKNFNGQVTDVDTERLHVLYLLTHFLYFGSRQIRELLKALHRDFVLYPIVKEARDRLGDTSDISTLENEVKLQLQLTRFFGVGNPSESGTHLLYFFRQENVLPKHLFLETHRIFSRSSGDIRNRNSTLREPNVKRYIFIDDLCGSGHQAAQYSADLVEDILRLNEGAQVSYFPLFATAEGLDHVRQQSKFTKVEAIYELDQSYKTFSPASRISTDLPAPLDAKLLKGIVEHYGTLLCPENCFGYEDGQLLVGFHHNTPDNTLPIIWFAEHIGPAWTPIFRRYSKVYGLHGAP